MVLFLFFCSGATALIYEVVWSKYLSLMFGSTIYAQTIVLAVFMGGLALGNRFIGARSDLLRHPLAAYGILELAIGIFAYYFDAIYRGADGLFVSLGSRLIGQVVWLLLLKAGLSVALLLLPTVFMGGTLPLLSAWLQKQSNDSARQSACFYSVNSLGAVCGAWLAGFWLIRAVGLDSTLEMTAMVNMLVGLTALALSRLNRDEPSSQQPAQHSAELAQTKPSTILPWLGLLVATTGAISMGLEVLASRSLSLIFGSSLQAFTIVLMAFILGIGLGSAAASSPRLKTAGRESLIFSSLLLTAVFLGLMVLGIQQWVVAYCDARSGLARTEMGYRFYEVMAGGFSLLLLGLPAGLIGAVLPLCIRFGDGEGLGNRVGRLLTWNTLGAVLGVLLTGFVLMPQAGLRNAFNLLAMALCLSVFFFAWRTRKMAYVGVALLVVAGLGISCGLGGTDWRFALSSGMYRFADSRQTPVSLEQRLKYIHLLFYDDGPDATVSVERGDGVVMADELALRISGKPEASTGVDMGTQLLLAHLPLLARPEAKDVFTFGLASGITAGATLAYPIEHLDIAENCRPVLEAEKYFTRWNRGVATNRLTRIWLEDARTVLKLTPRKYDVIISEPSNPWFATVGSVFTQEFFQIAASRLKPGGILAQWFHVYEMDDRIVELVLRTFGTVFPVMEIWDAGGDLVLLGSDRPWDVSLASLRRSYQRESVREDLTSIGLGTPEALLALQFASQRTAFAIAAPGPIQSDSFPILEYDAPRAFFVGRNASGITRFDERTWQSSFVSPDRRRLLATLDDPTLRTAFKFQSVNAELRQVLAPRLRPGTPLAQMGSTFKIPCVFLPETDDFENQVPPDYSEELKRLLRAWGALQQPGTNWLEQVQIIRAALEPQLQMKRKPSEQESAGRLASAAARACLLHDQLQLAQDLLDLGFQLDPQEPELGYLQRILKRIEGIKP